MSLNIRYWRKGFIKKNESRARKDVLFTGSSVLNKLKGAHQRKPYKNGSQNYFSAESTARCSDVRLPITGVKLMFRYKSTIPINLVFTHVRIFQFINKNIVCLRQEHDVCFKMISILCHT